MLLIEAEGNTICWHAGDAVPPEMYQRIVSVHASGPEREMLVDIMEICRKPTYLGEGIVFSRERGFHIK